jgi:hypothetical protein
MIGRGAAAVVSAVAVLLAGCSSSPPPQSGPYDLARQLAGKVTIDATLGHLRKLADLTNANKGNRAEGTPGYDAAAGYVSQLLRDRGFDVSMPEFEWLGPGQQGNQTLVVAGRSFKIGQASLLAPTPPGGLSAVAVRAAKPAGCAAADYAGVPVKGAIAVVDDSACSVVDKHNAAMANGAVGVLVVKPPTPGSPQGLFPSGYYDKLTLPTGVIYPDADAALRRSQAPVRLMLETKSAKITSRSVVAQTKTGDTHNVVVAGANLDTPANSPGINANGSGVAALLETATQLGSSPAVTNAVRFTFWGSTESGLVGSSHYVSGLDRDGLNDIALYLNFDALASPNAGYFTYDGDQSAQPSPDVPPPTVPAGSAGIERVLAGYLNLAGRRPADQPLGKAVDYSPFLTAGVPIGGVTTGTMGKKTDLQARLWGGTPGVAFDPTYRTVQDTVDNLNRDALAVTGPAVAFAIGTYAQSIDGANGVPSHDQRHREPAKR